jgi:hypothetical protein
MAADDELWAEVRRLYVETDEPVEVFARRLGVASRTVLVRARREGWPRRAARTGRAGGVAKPASPVPHGHPTRAARDALIRRFYRAISAKLSDWEKEMVRQGELSAAEKQERMRDLGTLIQSFEKVAGVAAGAQKLDEAIGQRTRPLTSADTQRMREEIARRLEHLNAARDAGGGSGAARTGAADEPAP